LRSTRSCSRARTTEGGFALIWAIGLALLFFLLIELMLIDSARELAEARRFRAKIVATTLAENGAELAAAQLVNRFDADVDAEDWQGSISGTMRKNADGRFEIEGGGEAKGTNPASARVHIKGRVVGTDVKIDYTVHTQ
jgi:hypothetical protein